MSCYIKPIVFEYDSRFDASYLFKDYIYGRPDIDFDQGRDK